MQNNINQYVQGLYKTNEFFVRITARSDQFEEGYWGLVKDPDGIERDHIDEFAESVESFQYITDYILEHKKTNDINNILDVGCGLGALLASISDKIKNIDLYGVEVSRFASKHAAKYATIYTGDMIDAEYEDDFFDVVTCHHVIEHIKNPKLLMQKITRILKPGGLLVLATPDFDSGAARRFKNNYRLLHDKTHISLFSNDSMHRFIRHYNYKIQKVKYPFFETKYFDDVNLLRLLDNGTVSPPFYGNFMTFFATKSNDVRKTEVLNK